MQKVTVSLVPYADKAAISLSTLCAMHCLLTPLAVAFLPSLTALGLEDEAFHLWMVLFVLPISGFALFLGCRRHRRWRVLAIGIAGLVLLAGAAFAGHELLGEWGEKALTLGGAFLVAMSHVQNYRLCQNCPACTSATQAPD